MKDIACRRVVNDHDFGQVRLHGRKVLDVCAIPICTVLAIVSSGEVLAILLQPVYDRICIFLNRCCEYDKVVPAANLTFYQIIVLDDRGMGIYIPFVGIRRNMASCARSTRLRAACLV